MVLLQSLIGKGYYKGLAEIASNETISRASILRAGFELCDTIISASIMSVTGFAQDETQKIQSSIDELVDQMKEKGYDITPYLDSPNFMLYPKIKKIFTTSPESVAFQQYNNCLKENKNEDGSINKVACKEEFDNAYQEYRTKLGLNLKIKAIKKFSEENQAALDLAEKTYGINKNVIAAIIGVETNFGDNIGHHYAFGVYASLYVFNHRQEFAIQQMEALMQISEQMNLEPTDFISSYGGAIGFGQFIPSSLRDYFVKDGKLDSMHDTIMSVGNYLKNKSKGDINEKILSYNKSVFYKEAVLELASTLD